MMSAGAVTVAAGAVLAAGLASRCRSVTAGPRFAVTGQGAGVDSLADEQDGLVTVPFEVTHRTGKVTSAR